jgi:hypothetical protein
MFRKYITSRVMIPVLLCLQIAPLVVFPLETYSVKTQEWWLPLLLALLTVISLIQILVRHSLAPWPWYLLSFSQGFNIISRIMTLMPHSTKSVEGGGLAMNTPYVAVAFATMLLSAFSIWYVELPEVRQRYAAKSAKKAAA